MSQVALLMQTLGRIEARQEMGFQEVNRRLDLQDRRDIEWRRHTVMTLRHIEKNGNGKSHIPYGKISVLLLLIVIGTLGHLAPTATRAAIQDVLRIGLRQLTAG
jgi:hypothetical protein